MYTLPAVTLAAKLRLKMAKRKESNVSFVITTHKARSEWFRGNDRLHEKLQAYGVPHTADLETRGPGYVERMVAGMIDFVVNGLERESRRLM